MLHGDVPYFICYGSITSYKHIKIRCVRVFIINGRVKINHIDYRSYCRYFVGYAATTLVILYWNIYQPFSIHRSHHVLFDEYTFLITIEYKHTPGSLLLQQDPESIISHSYLLNFITCELDLIPTLFFYTKIITYDI